LLCDSTTDVTHIDQFSICARYVDSDGQVQERFLRFVDVPSGSATADNLESLVRDKLIELNIDLKNIRGQSYDGKWQHS